MATPLTIPEEHVTSKELNDIIEDRHAAQEQNNEDIKSLLRDIEKKIEENENGNKKFKAALFANEDRLRKEHEERNILLHEELKDQRQLVSQSMKKLKNQDKKDREIKMLIDKTEELQQQIESLQQQLENKDLHMIMEEEPDSEATQSEDQHTERDTAKWLKEGIVNLTVTRINMHGPPGSGKTCSQCLLRNEKPPAEAVTDSTPIACRAVKATKASIHDDGCLKEVDSYDVLVALESDLNAHQQGTPSNIKYSADHVSSVAGHDENPVKMSSADPASDSDVEKVCANIIQAIQKGKAKSLQEHRWVYIIDSGGQLACQELLPLFTRAASLNIITIDLSKGINEKIDYQYRIGGKSYNCDPNVTCTNIDFLKTVLSSGAILQPYNTAAVSSDTTKVQCPIYFVLGTHKDKATQEDIDKLNNELSSLDTSCSKEKGYCLFPATIGGSKKIIYPINAREEHNRQEEAKKLCKTILNIPAATTFSIGIRWFVFELVLQEKAEKKNCDILEMDDVLSAGRSLQMKDDETKKALQFFHNVTIILYYPDVLPNIVFVNPHPILETLTHLLALTYEVDLGSVHHIANETPLLDELTNIATNGIFAESLLSKLKSDDQKIPNSDFIKLLLHLHIIAETADGYFFPCALKSYNGSSPEADLKPLLIVWRDPDTKKNLPVPHGVFPLTIVHLMNHKEPQFRIPPSSNKYFKYRDAMSFRICLHGDQIGTIHIINKYKHIEVYFTGDESAKYCPLLCKLITEAVTHSSDAVGAIQCHEHAFDCPLEKEEKCYCIVTNKDDEKVECSSCPKPAIIKGQEKYWNWFHCPPQSSSEDKISPLSTRAPLNGIQDLNNILELLKKFGFSEKGWFKLGLALGLSKDTLDAIEANNSQDVGRCLIECLSKWLKRADAVDSKGGATWDSLSTGLRSINENAVADELDKKSELHYSVEYCITAAAHQQA